MKIKTISYQRVKNLGNFQSERMEAIAEVDKDEDIEAAIESLKAIVHKALGLIKNKSNEEDNIDF
jgi:hypothetical protein